MIEFAAVDAIGHVDRRAERFSTDSKRIFPFPQQSSIRNSRKSFSKQFIGESRRVATIDAFVETKEKWLKFVLHRKTSKRRFFVSKRRTEAIRSCQVQRRIFAFFFFRIDSNSVVRLVCLSVFVKCVGCARVLKIVYFVVFFFVIFHLNKSKANHVLHIPNGISNNFT